MKKTFVIAMLLVLALTASTFAASFADVPANHWAYEAVNKLVAAGIIQGYPDGTYGGQRTLTRYEIAVIVSRLLDDIAAQREEMAKELEEAADSLSKGEAKDVTAIVMALLEKNKPEAVEVPEIPEGLTEKQAEEVVELIKALTFEFQPELEDLGADIDAIAADVADLDARVAALEAKPEASVSFSGTYSVDFNYVDIEGDPLPKEKGSAYYFVDPYDTKSGDYVEDVDEDTYNESVTDETSSDYPDYRLTDEEDYFTEDDGTIENALELNVKVNKGALSADVTMTGYNNVFGLGEDDTEFDFDGVEGTITAPDFTATIKDEQTVSFKDYLYNETELDGVVVSAGDNTYFIGQRIETAKEYTNIVDGDEDEYWEAERDVLVFGAKQSFDLVLPFNVYVGYEFADAEQAKLAIGDDEWDTSLVPTGDNVTVDSEGNYIYNFAEVKNTLVAFDTTVEAGDFDVTADLALPLNEGVDGYLFRLGATGTVGMLDVAANLENTKDMVYIQDDDLADTTKGFDVEVGTTIGFVDGSFKYEDYDDNYTTTFKAAVPAGNLSFGMVDVDGSYELKVSEDNAKKEVRALNAATSLAGIEMSYAYEYNVDNELEDEALDRVDDGVYNDDDVSEEDDDVNLHTIAASYELMEGLTAGVTAEFEKAIVADDDEIEFADEFDKTYTITADYAKDAITAGFEHVIDGDTTITGRYTEELFEVGFGKVLDGDLVVDGKVTAPTFDLVGVTVDASAAAAYNLSTEARQLEVNADFSKVVSDSLTLTGVLGWADKDASVSADFDDFDVDFGGVKKVAGIGAEYKITEDLTANAAYNYLDFAGEKEYTVKEATAGVSLSF